MSTVVDGAGGSAWAAIAHVMIASSWARTGSDVNRGAVGSIHTDRPSEPRRVASPGGSRSTSWATTWSVARSSVRGPAVSRLLRHGTLQVADRLQHIGPGPRRALLRHRLDHLGDDDADQPGRRGLAASSMLASSRSAVQPASAASVCHRVVRSAAPWPDLRDRVSADASRVERGALPP